jgi:hypothetical protein
MQPSSGYFGRPYIKGNSNNICKDAPDGRYDACFAPCLELEGFGDECSQPSV